MIQRHASSLSCAANENDTYPGKSRAASSPLCRIVCNVSPRGVLFTDSREQERHNALMSLISLPSCHTSLSSVFVPTCWFGCLLQCLSPRVPCHRVCRNFTASQLLPQFGISSGAREACSHPHTHRNMCIKELDVSFLAVCFPPVTQFKYRGFFHRLNIIA